jgi:hypothetical protein
MVFTQAMFIPKSDNGATGVAPGDLGQPSYDGPRALAAGQWHPDQSVSDRRGGPVPGVLASSARLRGATGTAPGEPVAAVAVPAITKAGTSGTETPLAANRHATRPGQGRHPSNGQFLATEDMAAGHPSMQQQPADRNARRFTPANTDLPGRDCAESTIQHHLARHMASANVNSVDLRGSSGMPAFAQTVQDPSTSGFVAQHLGDKPRATTPDTRAAAMPVPLIPESARDAGSVSIPSMPQQNGPAFRGGLMPQPAFGGILPHTVTGTAPGW